jgi:hypothetical protein
MGEGGSLCSAMAMITKSYVRNRKKLKLLRLKIKASSLVELNTD